MNSSIIRSWNGRTIRQREDGYLSLTDMTVACKKRIDNWMRLESTTSLVSEFRECGFYENLLPIETQEGRNGTTWGHPDIAIQLAQWGSPAFALQVSRWVREILLKGSTSSSEAPKNEPRYLPPLAQAEKALNIAKEYKETFDGVNPQIEQHLKDMVGNCLIDFMGQAINNPNSLVWMGVVNFAEVELGYSVPRKGTYRAQALGTWIRFYHKELSDKLERRFCNETQRDIYVYPIHDVREPLTVAVKNFFNDPDPSLKLKLEGAFKRSKN